MSKRNLITWRVCYLLPIVYWLVVSFITLDITTPFATSFGRTITSFVLFIAFLAGAFVYTWPYWKEKDK